MPLDGKIEMFESPELFTETAPIDKLITALRGPEPEWWSFARCRTCAMEVAQRMGIDWARDLGIPDRSLSAFFGLWSGEDWQAIRPRHVAAALEEYRDTGRITRPFHFVKAEQS